MMIGYAPAFAAPQYNMTCSSCHGMPPTDASTREITTGGFPGSHQTHQPASAVIQNCAVCHNASGHTNSHMDGQISFQENINSSPAGGKYRDGIAFTNQTSVPVLGSCSGVNCHFESVTPTWGGAAYTYTSSTVNDCDQCHGMPPAGTSPSYVGGAAGSHGMHDTYYPGSANCVKCHTDHVAEANRFAHASSAGNRDLIVSIKDPANVAGGSYSGAVNDFLPSQTNAFGTCSNLYCHSAGQGPTGGPLAPGDYASVEWGGSVNCGSCHKDMATSAGTSGSHYEHTNATRMDYECYVCHGASYGDATVPRTAGSIHVNKTIDLAFTGSASGTVYSKYSASGFAPGKGYYGTCSNAACHANVYGTGTVTTPVWGTAAGCEACHSAYPISASGPATGSHALHAGVACTSCHAAGTSATTSPSTGHADGDIDTAVGVYPTNIAKHVAGSGYASASCSTISCHGGGTMTWGANSTDTSCTKCHGKGTILGNYSTANAWQAAPGYATTGTDINGQTGTFTNGVSNDAQVGAHDAHLRGVNRYSDRQILCTDCHSIPGAANHANGTTDYSWSDMAKNIGTSLSARGALIPGYATGTCSNMYCHGGVLNGGSDTTPVWNDTTFLTAYAKNASICGKCHGAPPTSGATLGFNHNAITIASSCTPCHSHEGKGPTHIDGTLQSSGGACDTCHSYDTVGGSWGSGDHLDGSVAEGWGAHARHINHLKTVLGVILDANTNFYGSAAFNAVCGVCHTQNPANHTMDNSTGRMINFNDSTAYQNGQFAPLYHGVSGTASSVNPKTCSNVICHFGTSPQWQ